jgi:hypothetical protein
MLEIQNKEHFEKVKAFAEQTGQWGQLKEKLDYLANYACNGDRPFDHTKCVLYKDFAPYSFEFVMMVRKDDAYVRWFNGGLIYHGPRDNYGSGAGPTFAVTLSPTDGWSIHT